MKVPNEAFVYRITPAMTALIAGDSDPIARQFLPDPREAEIKPWELSDPIGDEPHAPVKGIVHRYPDRVLFKITPTCAVHCRFCFRRDMIGTDTSETLNSGEREAAFAYIETHPEIWEVVLSGGDPLTLSPRRIGDIVQRLDAIDHVSVIRWHSRVPVVDPDRMSDEMIAALGATNKAVYLAIHTNHAREHTDAVRHICRRLRAAGIVLLGQSVLLRGINDDPQSLADLMRSCVSLGIKPYYLHILDKARGTSHFRVPLDRAAVLVNGLRGHLSGLCQPSLMLDIPGGFGKVPVLSDAIVALGDRRYRVTDFMGRTHDYADDA